MKQVIILVFLSIATLASSQSYYVKTWFLVEAGNQPVPFETRLEVKWRPLEKVTGKSLTFKRSDHEVVFYESGVEVKRFKNQTTFPAALNGEKYLYPKYQPKLVVVQIKY